MTAKRDDPSFAELLNQHGQRYWANHPLFRGPPPDERPSRSPLAEQKAWADEVLRNAEQTNWPHCDLSRVSPKKRDRIIAERRAMRLAAQSYAYAWNEVETAFALRQPAWLAFAAIGIEFERCNQFVCTRIELPCAGTELRRGVTVWECVQEGFHRLETQPDWSNSGSDTHRKEGRVVETKIETAARKVLAQRPELGGARMKSELARQISQSSHLQDDRGNPLLKVDTIARRLKNILPRLGRPN